MQVYVTALMIGNHELAAWAAATYIKAKGGRTVRSLKVKHGPDAYAALAACVAELRRELFSEPGPEPRHPKGRRSKT